MIKIKIKLKIFGIRFERGWKRRNELIELNKNLRPDAGPLKFKPRSLNFFVLHPTQQGLRMKNMQLSPSFFIRVIRVIRGFSLHKNEIDRG